MHQDCDNLTKNDNLTRQDQDDILELVEYRDFFSEHVSRVYGEKCSAFCWDCLICRAHFLKEALEDFIDNHVWLMEESNKEKA